MSLIERIKYFYSNKPILKHLTFMMLLVLILVWLLSIWLGIFTHKGESVIVPDFSGVRVDDLDKFATNHHLDYEVIDSIFFTGKEKGSVVSQTPAPLTKVREGRKVYLTIVSFQPEKMPMPNFKDLSLRQAKSMIETYGLQIGTIKYIPSQFKDAILDQFHNGKSIAPGTMLLKGSSIELIVGDGFSQGNIAVPFLYGLTFSEAKNILNTFSLNMGETIFEDCDSTNGRIYNQLPACEKYAIIKTGSSISLTFKANGKFDFDALIEQKAKDTTQ